MEKVNDALQLSCFSRLSVPVPSYFTSFPPSFFLAAAAAATQLRDSARARSTATAQQASYKRQSFTRRQRRKPYTFYKIIPTADENMGSKGKRKK